MCPLLNNSFSYSDYTCPIIIKICSHHYVLNAEPYPKQLHNYQTSCIIGVLSNLLNSMILLKEWRCKGVKRRLFRYWLTYCLASDRLHTSIHYDMGQILILPEEYKWTYMYLILTRMKSNEGTGGDKQKIHIYNVYMKINHT